MKHMAATRQYTWLALILMSLLALGTTFCKGVSQRGETPTTITGIQTSVIDGWVSFDRHIRDAQVLQNLVLFTNSAPPWGQGPKDGEPFIAAFNPSIQEVAWEVKYASAAPIATNTQNLFVVKSSQLIAVDLNSGNEVWGVHFTDSGLSHLVCNDDLVVAANREALLAFNAVNGELLWRSDLPGPLDLSVPNFTSFTSWREYSALSIHDRTVYARILDYQDANECRFSLLALDTNDGSQRWRFPIQQSHYGECSSGTPLTFGDGLVLVGAWSSFPTRSCILNGLNENSGKVIWSYQTADGCPARSFFFGGTFVLFSGKNVWALEAQSGHTLWQQEGLVGVPQQVMVDRGWVILWAGGTSRRTLALIDLHSGGLLSEIEVLLPEACHSSTSVAGFSGDQVVLVAGNCIRSFRIGENGHLGP